jgi:hypothetical protein
VPTDRLTAEQFLTLQEAVGNSALMSGLRLIFKAEELSKLESMRSEALGHSRPAELIKFAAESRTWAEWEVTLKRLMERFAPQTR